MRDVFSSTPRVRASSHVVLRSAAAALVLGLMLFLPTAVHAEGPSDEVPWSMVRQPTDQVTMMDTDPNKVPPRGQVKGATPGWTTIVFDDIEGVFPGA